LGNIWRSTVPVPPCSVTRSDTLLQGSGGWLREDGRLRRATYSLNMEAHHAFQDEPGSAASHPEAALQGDELILLANSVLPFHSWHHWLYGSRFPVV
jgi:hypothetical protein